MGAGVAIHNDWNAGTVGSAVYNAAHFKTLGGTATIATQVIPASQFVTETAGMSVPNAGVLPPGFAGTQVLKATITPLNAGGATAAAAGFYLTSGTINASAWKNLRARWFSTHAGSDCLIGTGGAFIQLWTTNNFGFTGRCSKWRGYRADGTGFWNGHQEYYMRPQDIQGVGSTFQLGNVENAAQQQNGVDKNHASVDPSLVTGCMLHFELNASLVNPLPFVVYIFDFVRDVTDAVPTLYLVTDDGAKDIYTNAWPLHQARSIPLSFHFDGTTQPTPNASSSIDRQRVTMSRADVTAVCSDPLGELAIHGRHGVTQDNLRWSLAQPYQIARILCEQRGYMQSISGSKSLSNGSYARGESGRSAGFSDSGYECSSNWLSISNFNTSTGTAQAPFGFYGSEYITFSSTGVVPTGFTAGVRYYVVGDYAIDGTRSVQLSLTPGGTPITFSDLFPTAGYTLAAAINATATAITTTSAVTGSTIWIENEQMTVTAGSGTTSLTVTRGAGGTTAIAHPDPALAAASASYKAAISTSAPILVSGVDIKWFIARWDMCVMRDTDPLKSMFSIDNGVSTPLQIGTMNPCYSTYSNSLATPPTDAYMESIIDGMINYGLSRVAYVHRVNDTATALEATTVSAYTHLLDYAKTKEALGLIQFGKWSDVQNKLGIAGGIRDAQSPRPLVMLSRAMALPG